MKGPYAVVRWIDGLEPFAQTLTAKGTFSPLPEETAPLPSFTVASLAATGASQTLAPGAFVLPHDLAVQLLQELIEARKAGGR